MSGTKNNRTTFWPEITRRVEVDRIMLRQIRDRLQLDRPLAFALANRAWQAVSGPITIALLIRYLSKPEQGVYYAIIAIVGIQAYFELGLLNVLVSQAGHEAAVMNKAAAAQRQGTLATDQQWLRAAARMRDLIRGSLRWFTTAAVFYVVIATIVGWYTLRDSNVQWHGPLLAIIPIAAITVALAPGLSILEGAGYRDLVYRVRFLQIVAGSLVVWTALALRLGLWALVLSAAVQAATTAYVMFVAKANFFNQFKHTTTEPSDFRWTRDVVPVQWRVALIGATFHFATQFFVVIVVMFHSDADAAPLGMTLSITSAIQMLALAWVQTKYPIVSILHGSGKREQAGTLWRHTAIVSTAMLLLAFGALYCLIAGLPLLGWGIEDNFLRPWQVLVLSLGCLSNHIAAVQGFYVLSQRARPLLRASLIGSLCTAAAVWIGGYMYSTSGVIVGYALAMTLVLVPVHTLAYLQFRKQSIA